MLCLSACLLERPDDSAVIGLRRQVFWFVLQLWPFWGVAEGGDYTVVTPETSGTPDSFFNNTVSDFGLPWVSILILSSVFI